MFVSFCGHIRFCFPPSLPELSNAALQVSYQTPKKKNEIKPRKNLTLQPKLVIITLWSFKSENRLTL